MNFLLSVVMDKVSGDAYPDNTLGPQWSEVLPYLIVFVVAFALGYGVRHLIQIYRDAPDDDSDGT